MRLALFENIPDDFLWMLRSFSFQRLYLLSSVLDDVCMIVIPSLKCCGCQSNVGLIRCSIIGSYCCLVYYRLTLTTFSYWEFLFLSTITLLCFRFLFGLRLIDLVFIIKKYSTTDVRVYNSMRPMVKTTIKLLFIQS